MYSECCIVDKKPEYIYKLFFDISETVSLYVQTCLIPAIVRWLTDCRIRLLSDISASNRNQTSVWTDTSVAGSVGSRKVSNLFVTSVETCTLFHHKGNKIKVGILSTSPELYKDINY